MMDRTERLAVDGDRQVIATVEPGPHALERRGHPPHRAPRQGRIAGQRDGQPLDAGTGAEQQPRGQWWLAFQDPRLTELVDEATRNNASLAVAAAQAADVVVLVVGDKAGLARDCSVGGRCW